MTANVVITRQDPEGNLIESATLTPEEAVAAIRVVLERVERPAAALVQGTKRRPLIQRGGDAG